jgi:hypothetical protein
VKRQILKKPRRQHSLSLFHRQLNFEKDSKENNLNPRLNGKMFLQRQTNKKSIARKLTRT